MGKFSGFGITMKQVFRPRITKKYPKENRDKPERFHGRHVLNRYEDGMEKCIGCELCAGVCPARCIYVRGADNPPDAPVSPGEYRSSSVLSAPSTKIASAGQAQAQSSHPMHFSNPSG